MVLVLRLLFALLLIEWLSSGDGEEETRAEDGGNGEDGVEGQLDSPAEETSKSDDRHPCAFWMGGVPGTPGHSGHPGRDGRDGRDGLKGEKGDRGEKAHFIVHKLLNRRRMLFFWAFISC